MTAAGPAITVAICTFHRAALLPAALGSLAAGDRPRDPWELLLIDNGCEAEVARVAAQFADRLPLRYLAERAVGLSHARNRAVAEARAPVIVFTDDDVQFDRRWLCAMAAAVAAHPECRFWGGRIEPAWQVPRPAWFDPRQCPGLGDCIVRYDLGPSPRYWDPESPHNDPPFLGASLALRVDAVRGAGLFDPTLGHRGKSRGTGEDSWMVKALAAGGARGWYAADALVHHPVEPQRITRRYARRFAWRQGAVSVEMLRRERVLAGAARRPPRWLYRLAVTHTLAGAARWGRGILRRDAGQAFAGQYAALFNFSKLLHALKP
jgi:glycosyltransferase involved in cell wall biosynthesis